MYVNVCIFSISASGDDQWTPKLVVLKFPIIMGRSGSVCIPAAPEYSPVKVYSVPLPHCS